MVISAPMNEQELRNLMYTAQLESTTIPFVIRYPRGEGVMADWKKPFEQVQIGKGRKLKDGKDVAILSLGHPGNFAAAAIRDLRSEGITPAHYDMRFAKPLDEELLHEALQNYDKIITVEDGTVVGGFGSAVAEFIVENNYKNDLRILGIPDRLVEHGTLKELHHECGYDAIAIADTVREMMSSKVDISSIIPQ
jgi:1-deoxy-D-xylulose-5-phosphate synthase